MEIFQSNDITNLVSLLIDKYGNLFVLCHDNLLSIVLGNDELSVQLHKSIKTIHFDIMDKDMCDKYIKLTTTLFERNILSLTYVQDCQFMKILKDISPQLFKNIIIKFKIIVPCCSFQDYMNYELMHIYINALQKLNEISLIYHYMIRNLRENENLMKNMTDDLKKCERESINIFMKGILHEVAYEINRIVSDNNNVHMDGKKTSSELYKIFKNLKIMHIITIAIHMQLSDENINYLITAIKEFIIELIFDDIFTEQIVSLDTFNKILNNKMTSIYVIKNLSKTNAISFFNKCVEKIDIKNEIGYINVFKFLLKQMSTLAIGLSDNENKKIFNILNKFPEQMCDYNIHTLGNNGMLKSWTDKKYIGFVKNIRLVSHLKFFNNDLLTGDNLDGIWNHLPINDFINITDQLSKECRDKIIPTYLQNFVVNYQSIECIGRCDKNRLISFFSHKSEILENIIMCLITSKLKNSKCDKRIRFNMPDVNTEIDECIEIIMDILQKEKEYECHICMDNKVTHVYVVCGHMICDKCLGNEILKNGCTQCNNKSDVIKLFN